MSVSPKLELSYIVASQAQKEVTHNEALNDLDVLVHLSVIDRDLSSPPSSPFDGAAYIVGSMASGAWEGKEGQIAVYFAGWIFKTPKDGFLAFVRDEGKFLYYVGGVWTALASAI